MSRLFALVLLLIVYGSLYPWRLEASLPDFGRAVRDLLGGAGVLTIRDVQVNVLFYLPVGACAYLAFRSRMRRFAAAVLSVVVGTLLSISVEVAQVYTVGRRSSIYDVYANCFGSMAGTAVAAAYSRVSSHLRFSGTLRAHDRGALLLIVLWLAYLLFPFLPALPSRRVVSTFVHSPLMEWLPLVSAAVVWVVAGYAIAASGVRKVKVWLLISTLLIPAQVMLNRGNPTIAEFAGACAGAVAFCASFRPGSTRWTPAIAMVVVIVVRAVMPMQFRAQAQDFTWLPFYGLLQADWYSASQVLFEKLFFYAAAIWSLRYAGMRLSMASWFMAAVLAALEAIQVWLPRTPGTTDPVLALIIGIGFDAICTQSRRVSSPSETSA